MIHPAKDLCIFALKKIENKLKYKDYNWGHAKSEACQEQRPEKTQEHPQQELILTRLSPMESMNLDYCQLGNGYYIIGADRYFDLC